MVDAALWRESNIQDLLRHGKRDWLAGYRRVSDQLHQGAFPAREHLISFLLQCKRARPPVSDASNSALRSRIAILGFESGGWISTIRPPLKTRAQTLDETWCVFRR